MSDFPLDEELTSPPISPSSSVLSVRVLGSDEHTPEANPTPSQLNLSWSSGDIPVLLYDDAYVCVDQDEAGFSISDLTFDSTVNVDVSDRSWGILVSPGSGPGGVTAQHPGGCKLSRVIRTSKRGSAFLGLETLESSNTISSVGTFGPVHKNHRYFSQEDAPRSLPEASDMVPNPVNHQTEGEGAGEHPFTGGRRKRSSIVTQSQSISGIFASPSVLADIKRTSLVGTMSASNLSEISSTQEPRQQSQHLGDSNVEQTEVSPAFLEDMAPESPRTPRKSNTKTVSWISSSDWDCRKYKDYIAQENLSYSPAGSPTGRTKICGGDHEDEDQNSTPNPRRREPRSKILEHRDLNVIVETPRASHFAREIQDYHAEKPVFQETPLPLQNINSVRHESDEHSWLKSITVQFLVDQEGFRAAHPSFRFTGIARLRHPENAKGPPTTMAQFRPVTRQAFHFHYAPFESPPILRRVTVNFDETHDYLTKQALLTLKFNGVYMLHGQELSQLTPAAADLSNSKLYWQFEYMIDDRRAEGSGKIMEGEKNWTPLTFSCSPSLLFPTQGKRNSIMHVFKKGVATKLVAERLQPPGAVSAPKNPGNEPHPIEADAAQTSSFFTSKAQAWNVHKRGQSHGLQPTNSQKTAVPIVQSQNVESNARPARHRRASSSGESRRPSSSGLRFSTLVPSSTRRLEGADGVQVPAPSRHIIPPQKLAELLDIPCSLPESGQSPPSIRRSDYFAPLTPRPRYLSHVQDLSHFHTR